jgi:Tfp pilus assembly protein PilN
VLAGLLIAVGAYVFVANQATSRENEAVKLESEARALTAEADSLAAFVQFQELRETRTSSVRALAVGRFDWERMVREIARVLPKSVWMRKFDATVDGRSAGEGGGGSSGSSSSGEASVATTVTAGAAGAGGGTGGSGSQGSAAQTPTVKIEGCAREQQEVADALVRLRLLAGVEDVSIVKSERPEVEPGQAASLNAEDPSGNKDTCGATGRRPNLEWEIRVTFKPVKLSGTGRTYGKVPVSLGGGQ